MALSDGIPEVAGLDPAEARRLVAETQRRVLRRPAMFVGFVLVLLVPALLVLAFSPVGGLLGAIIAGGLIAAVGAFYVQLLVRPRVREELRAMGYPRVVRGRER